MNLVSQEESDDIWKNRATLKQLNELYHVLQAGGASPHLPWNIPFTKEGKFSCIDTEHPDRRPDFKCARKYMSKEMGICWDKIVQTNAQR